MGRHAELSGGTLGHACTEHACTHTHPHGLQVVLALTAMIVAAVPKGDWKKEAAGAAAASPSDTVPLRYDIPALQTYFSKRTPQVLQVRPASSFCAFLALLSG